MEKVEYEEVSEDESWDFLRGDSSKSFQDNDKIAESDRRRDPDERKLGRIKDTADKDYRKTEIGRRREYERDVAPADLQPHTSHVDPLKSPSSSVNLQSIRAPKPGRYHPPSLETGKNRESETKGERDKKVRRNLRGNGTKISTAITNKGKLKDGREEKDMCRNKERWRNGRTPCRGKGQDRGRSPDRRSSQKRVRGGSCGEKEERKWKDNQDREKAKERVESRWRDDYTNQDKRMEQVRQWAQDRRGSQNRRRSRNQVG